MQKILVVEDDFDIQELLRNFLQEAGYAISVASDGIEAIDMFANNQFDLILLDVMLPRIDGFSVCELIRRQSQGFLVYGVLAWFMPETYSNELNDILDEQTREFIAEISQMTMEESAGLFDRFLGNTNIDHMELFGYDGRQIDLPSKERENFHDEVIEMVAEATTWDTDIDSIPTISGSYPFSFFGDDKEYGEGQDVSFGEQFKPYEQFGMTYDADKNELYYNGKLVRWLD